MKSFEELKKELEEPSAIKRWAGAKSADKKRLTKEARAGEKKYGKALDKALGKD